MGRTLASVLFLGLIAACAWFLFPKEVPEGGSPEGPPRAHGGSVTGAGPMPGASGLVEAGGPAAAPSPQAVPGGASGGAEVRSLLQAGKTRDAVARGLSLHAGALRDPACAAAARDAALALASGGSSGPADRVARSDEARRLLGRLVLADAVPLAQVRERLDALNREVLFAGREVPGVVSRGAVKAGDTLDRLMKREWKGRVRAGYGLVLWLNNIPSPDRLRVGNVWVPEEPLRVLVRKREHELWVLLGEVPVRFFPVGLGLNGRTPEGDFEIEEMMPRPDYWPPGGKRIPFGQPGNPLGTRWMGFRDTPEAQGFGIHGTDDPASIGRDLSLGCVRMHNADAEQLFTWVSVGAKVEVRP